MEDKKLLHSHRITVDWLELDNALDIPKPSHVIIYPHMVIAKGLFDVTAKYNRKYDSWEVEMKQGHEPSIDNDASICVNLYTDGSVNFSMSTQEFTLEKGCWYPPIVIELKYKHVTFLDTSEMKGYIEGFRTLFIRQKHLEENENE